MDAGVAHMMPPPSLPPTAPRSLASTAPPQTIASLTEQATAELNVKREQLKLAMMELDLAERREKIATSQAERALAIKERELELAERERRLNPLPVVHQALPPPPPELPPPRADLRVSSEMGVSIPPTNDSTNRTKKKLAMSSELLPGSDVREQSAPYVRAPSVRDENRAENAPPEPTGGMGKQSPVVNGKENALEPEPAVRPPGTGITGHDTGRNQDINNRLAKMHSHKDHLKEEYLSKLDELDRQMAEAAIAQHRREILAEKVAEQAVRDAKMTRVTQLANLIAASLEMVKKSGDALDHVVLKLVDHLEQETAEEMALDDPSLNPLDPPLDGNEDLQQRHTQTLQQKLMSLMTSTPTTEQLEEAVGMIEGLKPKGEWDTMASLGANLSSLQNFMADMDGRATEEEEALAIANAVLAAEGKEAEEGVDGEEPGVAESVAAAETAAAAAPEEEEEPGELPIPPELADKLNTLRGKKKYLEEIRELELQVRALQEQAAAGFPPEVEPPEVFPEDGDGDGEGAAEEGAAEPVPEPA
jgi:hypothetical protein